jgi:hypothetical protein
MIGSLPTATHLYITTPGINPMFHDVLYRGEGFISTEDEPEFLYHEPVQIAGVAENGLRAYPAPELVSLTLDLTMLVDNDPAAFFALRSLDEVYGIELYAGTSQGVLCAVRYHHCQIPEVHPSGERMTVRASRWPGTRDICQTWITPCLPETEETR